MEVEGMSVLITNKKIITLQLTLFTVTSVD